MLTHARFARFLRVAHARRALPVLHFAHSAHSARHQSAHPAVPRVIPLTHCPYLTDSRNGRQVPGVSKGGGGSVGFFPAHDASWDHHTGASGLPLPEETPPHDQAPRLCPVGRARGPDRRHFGRHIPGRLRCLRRLEQHGQRRPRHPQNSAAPASTGTWSGSWSASPRAASPAPRPTASRAAPCATSCTPASAAPAPASRSPTSTGSSRSASRTPRSPWPPRPTAPSPW